MKKYNYSEHKTSLIVPDSSTAKDGTVNDMIYREVRVRITGDGLREYEQPFMPLHPHETNYIVTDHIGYPGFKLPEDDGARDKLIQSLQELFDGYDSAQVESVKKLKAVINKDICVYAHWILLSDKATSTTAPQLVKACSSLEQFEDSFRHIQEESRDKNCWR